jgi:hypothetical protein
MSALVLSESSYLANLIGGYLPGLGACGARGRFAEKTSIQMITLIDFFRL